MRKALVELRLSIVIQGGQWWFPLATEDQGATTTLVLHPNDIPKGMLDA